MTRADWIELSALCCVMAMYLGIAAAFLINGMGWAAAAGTIPSWAFLISTWLGDTRWPCVERRGKK